MCFLQMLELLSTIDCVRSPNMFLSLIIRLFEPHHVQVHTVRVLGILVQGQPKGTPSQQRLDNGVTEWWAQQAPLLP